MKLDLAPDAHQIETPSGKDAAYENFPVGSFLLPRNARPHVATFYAFARAIDDIADNPRLEPDEKLRRLDGFEAAISGSITQDEGFEKGYRMCESLNATGIASAHCLDLIKAFKQDAVKSRYETWDDLVAYCMLSAAPVGRYLIDLIDGNGSAYTASDNLCVALQVINHMQDCGDDYRVLDRVYLPQSWMREMNVAHNTLAAEKESDELRAVIDRCLERTSTMLDEAAILPDEISSKRLSMEAKAIYFIARSLVSALKRTDVLRNRVELSKARFAWCMFRGML